MSNTLLTVDFITKKAVSMFVNSNAFLQTIDRRYEKDYGMDFKIGSALRIRLPVDYTVGLGQAITPESTVEQYTTLTVGTQNNVPMSFSSSDYALSIDDFTDRFLEKAVNDLAAVVASNIMSIVDCGNAAIGSTIGVPNFASNVNGSSEIISPIQQTWLNAGAILDKRSANRVDRTSVLSPATQANTVASFSGLFNPTNDIANQYKTGSMGGMMAFGIKDWRLDQTVISHTTGTATGMEVVASGPTVTNGTQLNMQSISGTLAAGDIITIANVNSVNRLTKVADNSLQTFVVTSAVTSSSTAINVYPAIIGPLSGPLPAQYQTVTALPAVNAAVNFVSQPGETYYKNLVYKPEAFTMVTVDLPLPRNGVVKASRANYDGVSLRMIEGYEVLTDLFVTRLDILYGAALPKPDWACVVADTVTNG